MFSTKAQVTLILHTARSKNEMNMAVDKWIKCLKFVDLVSPVKLNSFCPHSIHRKHDNAGYKYTLSQLHSTKSARFVEFNVY